MTARRDRAATKRYAPPDTWEHVKPVVWLKAIQTITLSPGGKAVACALALHANKTDGRKAHPGLSRLEWESGASRHTVVATLADLEAMWLIDCVSRSTGRGNASEYDLMLHDQTARYGTPFSEWLAARRPSAKGFPSEPFAEKKGSREPPEGFPVPPQRVPEGTPPGFTTRKDLISSVRSAHGRTATQRADDYEIESDLDDLDALEAELENVLFADAVEMSTITGMLQDGRHPRAIINKILADRER
jgi:hypothetical protein